MSLGTMTQACYLVEAFKALQKFHVLRVSHCVRSVFERKEALQEYGLAGAYFLLSSENRTVQPLWLSNGARP
jgi:hypothetical protein